MNDKWNNKAKQLTGKTIKTASYMTPEEAVDYGWDKLPLVIEFTDGSILIPSSDDEGNNGGALFGSTADHEDMSFPVMYN